MARVIAVLGLVAALLVPVCASAQARSDATVERAMYIPLFAIQEVNAGLAQGGAPERIASVTAVQATKEGAVAFIRGRVQMRCGLPQRPTAETTFLVVSRLPVLEENERSFRSRGLRPVSIEAAIRLFSSTKEGLQLKLLTQLIGLAVDLCYNPPAHVAHIGLSLWLRPDESDGLVVYDLLNPEKFAALQK